MIAWLPARLANLAPEHSELVTQGQDFGTKPGVGPAADDQGFQQEANHDVKEGEEHDLKYPGSLAPGQPIAGKAWKSPMGPG